MSSSSSYNSNYNPNQKLPSVCYCGKALKWRTSWTKNNPCRRFLTCPNSLSAGKKCNFFFFVDPALPNEWYKNQVYELSCLFNDKYNQDYCDFTDYKKLLELKETEHSKYMAKMELLKSKMEEENQKLKEELEKNKSNCFFYKRCLLVMIAVVVLYIFL